MTIVIAICGTMGSGKSTFVENVTAALPDCRTLHEDDFNRTTDRSLAEIDEWWERGASVDEFDLSQLIQQLAVMCPDKSPTAKAAAEKSRRGETDILLLETHFGRLHPELNPWIDYQCWIDVPADIAVMRKVAQLSAQLRSQPSGDSASEGLRWIENFCKGYLTTTRKLFEMQRQKVRDLSDLSIDGHATPLNVCAEFLQKLPEAYKPDQVTGTVAHANRI
jgi:hypothetical protein